jgi:hypothetical protein
MTSHKKRGIAAIIGLAIMASVAATTALASSTSSSPNSFGGPGNPPVLKASCARSVMWLTPAGQTWAGPQPNGKTFVFSVDNVFDTQIKCLVTRLRDTRTELFAVERCLTSAVPAVAEAPADKGGFHDETGLSAIRAYLKAQRDCVFTATGGAR